MSISYQSCRRTGRRPLGTVACLGLLLVLSVGAWGSDLFEVGELRLWAGGGNGEGGPAAEVSLLPQGIAAGTGQRFWDGRDDGGRPAASGVYFAVLRGEGLTLQRRLLLVR